MQHTPRLSLYQHASAPLQAMINLSAKVKQSSLGARLVELVFLRVSQINGCGVCVDMHWRALVKDDCDPRHLNAVAAFREAPFFNAREQAALNWAEAVNAIPFSHPSDQDFAELKRQFSDEEIAELSYAIAVIRGWNLINVSLRSAIPENPPPGM
jgi:AhpD family alkylhydroperoxidase